MAGDGRCISAGARQGSLSIQRCYVAVRRPLEGSSWSFKRPPKLQPQHAVGNTRLEKLVIDGTDDALRADSHGRCLRADSHGRCLRTDSLLCYLWPRPQLPGHQQRFRLAKR